MKAEIVPIRSKRKGHGLEIKTIKGRSGRSYLVLKAPGAGFHVFVEVEAKAAAKDCGGKGRNTREMWRSIWEEEELTEEELAELRASQEEVKRGEWEWWENVRRRDV